MGIFRRRTEPVPGPAPDHEAGGPQAGEPGDDPTDAGAADRVGSAGSRDHGTRSPAVRRAYERPTWVPGQAIPPRPPAALDRPPLPRRVPPTPSAPPPPAPPPPLPPRPAAPPRSGGAPDLPGPGAWPLLHAEVDAPPRPSAAHPAPQAPALAPEPFDTPAWGQPRPPGAPAAPAADGGLHAPPPSGAAVSPAAPLSPAAPPSPVAAISPKAGFRPRLAPGEPNALLPTDRLPVPGRLAGLGGLPTVPAQGSSPVAPGAGGSAGAGHFDSPELTIDDVGVTARRRPGLVEQVAWLDLVEVAMRSVASSVEGAGRGSFWLLGSRSGTGVVVPASGPASDALLQRLQALPGFDNRMVAQGLVATGDALTVVWRER